jgi:5-methylcytosine-specific restriction protein A
MFVPGGIYRRHELHERFGGQRQSGISTPSGQHFIMLFAAARRDDHGYQNGWSKDGVYLYTGVGLRGDMSFERGNAAILEHATNGEALHLFENDSKGHVRYVGEMICTGFRETRGLDVHSNDRRVIIFELTAAHILESAGEPDDEYEQLWREPLNEVRRQATVSYLSKRSPSARRALAQTRSKAIRVYVLRRANGRCEACGEKSTFTTSSGRPYLEPHHIRRCHDGGPDDPRWVIGLCPNCHRRAHDSEDKAEFNQSLERIVEGIEKRRVKSQNRHKDQGHPANRRGITGQEGRKT